MKSKLEMILIVFIVLVDVILFGVAYKSNHPEQLKEDSNNEAVTANYISYLYSNHIESNKLVKENLIVYEDMTLIELENQLNKSLKSTLANKGHLIASYSLEKGVDPYMATAIMLHETGCNWECSYLVKTCNNVGGQKGSGCGSYSAFPSLDEGIKAFIDNLSNNFISKGLTTPEAINPRYAESTTWAQKVNGYINKIKAQ